MKGFSALKRKQKGAAFLLLASMLVSFLPNVSIASSNIIYSQDFENIDAGERPTEFTYGDAGGSIEVVTSNDGKHLSIKNEIDGVYTYVEYPDLDISNTLCTFGLDFLQLDVRSTQSVILELKNGGDTILRISTNGENIVYCTDLTLDESSVLVQDYYANKWYSFNVAVDLINKSATVWVADNVFEDLPLLDEADSLTSMRSYTSYSPGYMLDNLTCNVQQNVKSIVITGNEDIFIPQSGEYSYEYSAYLLDENGNTLSNLDVNFEAIPSLPTGVTMSADGNKMSLIVSSSATECDFQIRVTSPHTEESVLKDISLCQSVLSEARIIGPNRIAFIDNTKNTYEYECRFYDAEGNEMQGSYTWNLKQSLAGVEFDSSEGVITVKEDLSNNNFVVLEAVYDEDPSIRAEKKIAALDVYTYRTDEQRMNKVLEYIDKILVSAADKYNGTPLLANGIDVDTEQHVTLKHEKDAYHPNQIVVPSDVAHQYNFMRVLYGLTEITGDSFYKNRAKSIYQYYLDAAYYSPTNGLLYLGGHCGLDLLTGNRDYAGRYADIHEYKDHFGFYDPWFEVDPEFTENYLKTVFVSHFYDVKNLFFNRHSKFSTAFNTENVFKDLNAYDESDLSIIRDCTGLTMRSAGNDMMFALLELYKHTGDTDALTWARRVLDRYIALQHPETNISVYQYNTGYGDPNCKELPNEWWLRDDYNTFTSSNYGDRFQNQFADDLIEKGYFDESERDFLVEGNFLNGVSGAYGTANLIDLKMAESIGMDESEGRFYAENTLKAMAGVIKYGYIPEKNAFNAMMSDGTVLNGYQFARNGYHGKVGTVFTTSSPDAEFFYAAIKVFGTFRDFEGYEEEKAILWSFIRNYAEAFGLGDLGENAGDEIKVNLTVSSSDPKLLISVIELYKNTGNYDVLNLARMIGNNIIANNMSNGYFVKSSSAKYSELDDFYAYSLCLLDAATRGDFESVPVSYMGKGYFHTSYVDERGRNMAPAFDYNFIWNTSRKSIYVKEIVADKKEFVLSPGEKQAVNISIYPDDASTTAINWYTQNPAVARIDEDNVIYAYSEGTVKLTGVSNDLKAKIELYVTVTTADKKEN